jgi:hypothetical protein
MDPELFPFLPMSTYILCMKGFRLPYRPIRVLLAYSRASSLKHLLISVSKLYHSLRQNESRRN